MACNPTRLELSNTDATSVQVTISPDPGDGATVTLEVPGLSINESDTTSGAVATYSIAARTEPTNGLWDGTVQVGSNAPADIVVQIVETSAAQTVGVTVSSSGVSYCAPTGGGGRATSLDGPVVFTAKNTSGGTITKGQVVYVSGVSGTVTTVGLADCNVAAQMPAFGLVNSASANNNAEVEIVTYGEITGMDTSSFSVGDVVYVSPTPGALRNTPPEGEAFLIQNMGKVVRSHATEGIIKVIGAGRTNATPNLNTDRMFLGNASNQAVATDLSSVGLTKFNQDLRDSYHMMIETPAVKTYTIDGRAVTDRTIGSYWAKTTSGTAVCELRNDGALVKSITANSTGTLATGIANTSVSQNDAITLVVTTVSSAVDLVVVVSFDDWGEI